MKLVFIITFWHELKLQWGIFCSPPSDVDKFESVILEQSFLVAQDLNVFVVISRVQQLLGDELLEVGDGGKGGAADELSVEISLESNGMVRRRFVSCLEFKENIDLQKEDNSFNREAA